MQVSSQNVKAIFMALIAFFFYSIADSLLKSVMPYYETAFAGTIVTTIHLVFFFFAAPFIGGIKPIFKPNHFKITAIRGMFAAGTWIFFIIGMRYNDLSVNYSILLSSSIWVALFSVVFLKIKLGIPRWIAILIGFIGVLIVMRPTTEGFQWTSIYPLLGALSFTAMALITRFVGNKEKQSTILFYAAIANLLAALCLTQLQGSWQAVNMNHLPVFIISALFYLSGNILSIKAFSIGDTSAVNPTQYSQIIWGAMIGYFFFFEVPTIWTITGAGLIILSGIYMVYREHKVEKYGTRTR